MYLLGPVYFLGSMWTKLCLLEITIIFWFVRVSYISRFKRAELLILSGTTYVSVGHKQNKAKQTKYPENDSEKSRSQTITIKLE